MNRAVTKQDQESVFAYLRYATMGDFLTTAWYGFLIWVVIVVLTMICGFILDAVGFSSFSQLGIPRWLWVTAFLGAVLWFLRGQNIEIPYVGFKAWVFLTLITAAVMFTSEIFPWWLSAPFIWAAYIAIVCLAFLANKGKGNFQKLSGQTKDAE